MNEYEIGRDLEALRCRLEKLECRHGEGADRERRVHAGVSSPHGLQAGVAPDTEPMHWKPQHPWPLPPFLQRDARLRRLGLDRGAQFDVLPESKSWTCHPEPLILSINWFAGGSDPFYQFQDQLFSVIRFTDPNTKQVSSYASYQARRVALGKAKSHYFPPSGNPRYQMDPGYYPTSQFRITLRGIGNANIGGYVGTAYTIVDCHESIDIDYSWNINPGIYELVTGATWEVTGAQTVDRC